MNIEDRKFISQQLFGLEDRLQKEIRKEIAAVRRDMVEMENRLNMKIETGIEHLAQVAQNEFSVVRKEFA